jgi:hypothetical protein
MSAEMTAPAITVSSASEAFAIIQMMNSVSQRLKNCNGIFTVLGIGVPVVSMSNQLNYSWMLQFC